MKQKGSEYRRAIIASVLGVTLLVPVVGFNTQEITSTLLASTANAVSTQQDDKVEAYTVALTKYQNALKAAEMKPDEPIDVVIVDPTGETPLVEDNFHGDHIAPIITAQEQVLNDAIAAGRIDPERILSRDKKVWVYLIQWGDTLTKISSVFSVSIDEIAELNKIKNVNLIYADSTLRIPRY